jgi:hypothetical protein
MTDAEFRDALDGLFAYDVGSVDSGIHDEALRARCIAEIDRHFEDETAGMAWLSRLIRDMWLSEEALTAGYTIEDALEFVRWLDDRMEVSL